MCLQFYILYDWGSFWIVKLNEPKKSSITDCIDIMYLNHTKFVKKNGQWNSSNNVNYCWSIPKASKICLSCWFQQNSMPKKIFMSTSHANLVINIEHVVKYIIWHNDMNTYPLTPIYLFFYLVSLLSYPHVFNKLQTRSVASRPFTD